MATFSGPGDARTPGGRAAMRQTAREERRRQIRQATKQTGGLKTGDARIIAACMRNELGYCVLHNAYDGDRGQIGPLGL